MRTKRIREEKPRPKRRRRDDERLLLPSPGEFGAGTRARELLSRLRAERDSIDDMLHLA
jgi:hypothetical protein